MNTTLILEPELKEWCGYTSRTAIMNWLDTNQIPYKLGKDGRICTTATAVEKSLIGDQITAVNTSEINF